MLAYLVKNSQLSRLLMKMAPWYEEGVELLGLQSRYAGFRAIDGVNLTIDKIQSLRRNL